MKFGKYRGRRSYDKKWIYGSLLVDSNGDYHIIENKVIEKDGHHICIDSDSPMFFDNETVGPFTGRIDKNDVEIYDGDIVRVPYNGIGDVIVKYIEKELRWNISAYNLEKLYVVGNSHESGKMNEK